jgi:hypothetical protein
MYQTTKSLHTHAQAKASVGALKKETDIHIEVYYEFDL